MGIAGSNASEVNNNDSIGSVEYDVCESKQDFEISSCKSVKAFYLKDFGDLNLRAEVCGHTVRQAHIGVSSFNVID